MQRLKTYPRYSHLGWDVAQVRELSVLVIVKPLHVPSSDGVRQIMLVDEQGCQNHHAHGGFVLRWMSKPSKNFTAK
jgi:hypothetical protein